LQAWGLVAWRQGRIQNIGLGGALAGVLGTEVPNGVEGKTSGGGLRGSPINMGQGNEVSWCHYCQLPNFKIFTEESRRAFHRAANAIFGCIGRVATEEVVLQLVRSKCIPILLYGLEACPLRKADLNVLDFVVNRFFMKLFRTNNIGMVKECQSYFSFQLPTEMLQQRTERFDISLSACQRHGCNLMCFFPCHAVTSNCYYCLLLICYSTLVKLFNFFIIFFLPCYHYMMNKDVYYVMRMISRSSAVAERPRDASCLSVVSFNIPTAQLFYY